MEVAEANVADLQLGMTQENFTSQDLVRAYLDRIERYEPLLHAAIALNPNALAEADALDRERKAGRVRGPLHGVPIALKDNILAHGMPTTGGALAFAGYVAPYEATLTARLREAGAVIIAKTSLTELASWVGLSMPGGYSAVGGYSLNPYDPRPDPRATDGRPALSPAGSSSGVGTAASLWAASVGTETSGSILSPSGATLLVGIKPTVGRISRHGVIPLTADQDTPGPMARTVADAAILLGAMEGGDRNDPATAACRDEPAHDYRPHLKLDGLKGARIGIPRAFFFDPVTPPGASAPAGGLNPAQVALVTEAIAVLKEQGVVIVDPADIPSVLDPDPEKNFVRWNSICVGPKSAGERNCSTVLKYGFKRDFNAFLKSLGAGAPVKSLTELRAFNIAHASRGAMRHGQSQLDNSDEMDAIADRARYETDRKRDLYLSRAHGLDEAIKSHRLDALLMPGGTGGIGSRAGYPTVQVPIGFIPVNADPPFPQGFDARPQPYGIGFTGLACTEGRLIELAFAFEQATRRRVPPAATP